MTVIPLHPHLRRATGAERRLQSADLARPLPPDGSLRARAVAAWLEVLFGAQPEALARGSHADAHLASSERPFVPDLPSPHDVLVALLGMAEGTRKKALVPFAGAPLEVALDERHAALSQVGLGLAARAAPRGAEDDDLTARGARCGGLACDGLTRGARALLEGSARHPPHGEAPVLAGRAEVGDEHALGIAILGREAGRVDAHLGARGLRHVAATLGEVRALGVVPREHQALELTSHGERRLDHLAGARALGAVLFLPRSGSLAAASGEREEGPEREAANERSRGAAKRRHREARG